MKPFIEKIVSRDFIYLNLGSAGAVFRALEAGEVDVGIVGRMAKNVEFSGYWKRVGTGYTLVNDRKQMILNDELPLLKINTSLSESLVEKKFSYLKNVIYHDKMSEVLDSGDVWLISWEDWRDNFELLIPVDKDYNKNPDFRVPHIFSKTKENLEKVEEVFNGKESD